MKHLKKYNESNSEPDYQKISREEYSRLVFGDDDMDYKYLLWSENNPVEWHDFTDHELEEISKVSGERLYYDKEDGWNYKVLGICKPSYEQHCKVVKLDDEWFIVEKSLRGFREGDKYFKCDQLHGLLDLLKTIKRR